MSERTDPLVGVPPGEPAGRDPDAASAPSLSPAAAARPSPVVPAILATLLLVALLAIVAVSQLLGGADPTRGLPAWDALDARWGTYLSEREWGTPREAVGGDGWGLDYLGAIKTDYRFGEDGIAGLTTREGDFDIGWALWDERAVRVSERLFGWSNPSGEHGEAIVDRRTFGANTPTSSYHRYDMEYPAAKPHFDVALEGARADAVSGVLRASATTVGEGAAPLDIVLKGWFHDPDRRVELIPNGLLLHGPASVVAIVGPAPSSAQVSDEKRALDRNLRAGGLAGEGPGHIGALAYHLEPAAGATATVELAWAEAADADAARARASELLDGADEILAFRRDEADGLFRGRVTQHEDVYRQALMSLLWSQSLYTWDGTTSYAPAWAGKVDAHDVLVMPDKWEFPWLATWDTGFQAVTAALIDPELGADQLRFLFSDRWQQPSGALPCAEWVMDKDCPPVFAWAAWRVHEAGAGTDFLREVYPGLQRNYDYWWKTKAVEPAGLFTWGFEDQGFSKYFRPGMDNLPWGVGQAQADASGFMALSARYLAKIAEALGDTAGVERYTADLERIAAAVNATLWDDGAGFYFDLDEGGSSFIPTKSYSGLTPLIAGIVPADRMGRVLEALRDPAQLLSPYGVRSVTAKSVIYQPGYAKERGVNSNWRGPVWIALNYLIVEALTPVDPGLAMTIREAVVAAVEADWRATGRFHEYFDAETGAGLGADAQAGWTALVANLVAEGWPAASK
jgi:Mannosylglycerate hydrolase MGH1-like glycoside hydrolase domain